MLKVDNIISLWRVVISNSDISYEAQIINLSRERNHKNMEGVTLHMDSYGYDGVLKE